MRSKVDAFLNLIGLLIVLTVNALANILPINGYNTGQISGFYPNYFVPAGFTFAIWGIIYLLLIGFVFCSFFAAFGRFDEAGKKAIDALSPLFQISCLLNAGWIVVWHYLYLATSLLIMVCFLVLLILLFLRIKPYKLSMPVFHRIWIHHAFLVYLGWISVATIANTTALFVGFGWDGSPLSPETWSILLIIIAMVLGFFMVGRQKEPAFGFVLSWAFYGIYAGQHNDSRAVSLTAAVGVCLVLALSFTILIRKGAKN
jgi:hypothetical protein